MAPTGVTPRHRISEVPSGVGSFLTDNDRHEASWSPLFFLVVISCIETSPHQRGNTSSFLFLKVVPLVPTFFRRLRIVVKI